MILIIDDITDNCDIMSRHLRREGYEVSCAQSAKEASDLLETSGVFPQLIILDVMMPETDGRAFLRDLRRNDRFKDVPVLVCTANSSYSCMSEMLDLGANGYLIKGLFDRDGFLRTVEQYAGPPRTPTLTLVLQPPAATATETIAQ
jgi:CheY-like chemotaxis protein